MESCGRPLLYVMVVTITVAAVPPQTVPGRRPAGVALLRAASRGETGRVTKILRRPGVDVNYAEKTGWYRGYTALMWAAASNSSQMVATLLSNGADVNSKSYADVTAVFLAAKEGFLTVVKQLLRNGARPDVPTIQGFTSLLYATWNGHLQVVEELLAYKADPNFQTPSSSESCYCTLSFHLP
nr:ankyrin repeat domain-containing protein 29-like [Cherax quadricarinatus]